MARKERNLANFADVASNGNENGIIENTKNNNSININNKNDNEDIFDKLIDGKKKKQPKNVWTGVYLKPEIANVLEQLAKKGGKGVKSEVVNEALRRVFIEKGLMDNGNQL